MSILTVIDSPLSWAVGGFAIGLGLGVTSPSVWLLAVGLGGFVLYLKLHGPTRRETETRLFAAGPAFMLSWLVGFVVHGLVF